MWFVCPTNDLKMVFQNFPNWKNLWNQNKDKTKFQIKSPHSLLGDKQSPYSATLRLVSVARQLFLSREDVRHLPVGIDSRNKGGWELRHASPKHILLK